MSVVISHLLPSNTSIKGVWTTGIVVVSIRGGKYAGQIVNLHLEICTAVSDAGGPVNEDIVGYTRDCAWVIDGATGVGNGLTDEPSDAAWFARTADAALRKLLPNSADLATAEVLRLVVKHCRESLQREARREAVDRSEYPCAAIALVRVREGGLELTTLGDCRIVYRDPGEGAVRLFGPSRIEIFERRTLGLMARLIHDNPGLQPSELRRSLAPQLQENRRSMNTPDGYWVLSIDEEAVDHLDQITIPSTGELVALASDGFLRLVELFHALPPAGLLEIRDNAGARSTLENLRRLEAGDPQCRAFLRVKASDDASFMAVRGVPVKGP
jgi:hypothetical protein